MRRKCATISAPLGGAHDTLCGLILFARDIGGGLDLLGIFEAEFQLIDGQSLGPATEAMTLHFLDDLHQPLAASALGEDHRLQRFGIVGKIISQDRHEPDYIMRKPAPLLLHAA
jgi:hypothetical protein